MAIGLWHVFNTAKNVANFPSSHLESRPWFTSSYNKYLELYVIMAFTLISITIELFVTPQRHLPWDSDGTISLSHMNRMEHATISLFFFVYACIALVIDRFQVRTPRGLVHALGALAFAEELLLFHFHSSEHGGVEGQYHRLLELAVGGSLVATVVEAGIASTSSGNGSGLVGLVRSSTVLLQGVWLVHTAFVLWILTPKGCELAKKKDVVVVKCSSGEMTERAMGMANLYFSWDMLLVVCVSLGMLGCFAQKRKAYMPLKYSCVGLKEYSMKGVGDLGRAQSSCSWEDQMDMSDSDLDVSTI